MRNVLPALALASLVAIVTPLAAPAQVAAAPTVQSFSPSSLTAGSLTIGHPLTVVIIGTGFRPGMTATVSSATITPREMPLVVEGPTRATLTLRVPVLETPGKLTIVLGNPPPAKSVSIVFTLTAPAPTGTVAPKAVPTTAPTVVPTAIRTASPAPPPTAAPTATPNAPTFNLGLSNPGPGGGAGQPTGPNALTLQPQNPAPVLVSISPTTAAAGASPLTLTVLGNNFTGSSVVSFGGYAAVAASRTSTSMTVMIPAAVLTPGIVPVSVSNPAPGGGTSAALRFTVTTAANPAPAVSSVTPASIPAGSGARQVTVTGAGFIASTTGSLGGVAGAISGNTMTFNLPASSTATSGTLSGLIANPQPGGGSASFTVNVLNGAPTVTGFAPTSLGAGASAASLQVAGSNFINGSVVTVGGTPMPTTFVSPTQLVAQLPAAVLQRGGNLQVGVTTPAPGGGSGIGGSLVVTNPAPALTGLTPSSIGSGAVATTIIATGTGFTGQASARIGTTVLGTVYNSATSLSITIPATLLASAGTLAVSVVNPAPGGGTSGSVNLQVANPVPVVTGVSPASLAQSTTNATLTVTGSNFFPGAVVNIGGSALVTTFVSPTQLTAVLPAPYPVGRLGVTVTNPVPGGGTSAPTATILISSPPPALP